MTAGVTDVPPRRSKIDACMQLTPAATSAGQARRFVATALGAWGCAHLTDVVVLLTSELVTNAILHAGSPIEVEVRRERDGVRVEVRDHSATHPVRHSYGDEAMTGRGLSLLSALASRWGVTAWDGGKSVWFELAD